jgi:hypothetical protein
MKNGEMFLIENETDASQFQVHQIIIPIIGSETVFNPNSIAHTAYEKLLKKEEITLADFENHCER